MKYSVLISRLNQYKRVLLPRKRIILLFMVLAGLNLFCMGIFSTGDFYGYHNLSPCCFYRSQLWEELPIHLIYFLGAADPGMEAMQMIGVLKSRSLSEAVAKDSVIFRNEPRLMAEVILELNPTQFSLIRWMMQLIFPPKPLTQTEKDH